MVSRIAMSGLALVVALGTSCGESLVLEAMCGVGRAIDFKRDIEHCGGCDMRCSDVHAKPQCLAGTCALHCEPGWADGDSRPDTGCECWTGGETLGAPCGDCGRYACREQLDASGESQLYCHEPPDCAMRVTSFDALVDLPLSGVPGGTSIGTLGDGLVVAVDSPPQVWWIGADGRERQVGEWPEGIQPAVACGETNCAVGFWTPGTSDVRVVVLTGGRAGDAPRISVHLLSVPANDDGGHRIPASNRWLVRDGEMLALDTLHRAGADSLHFLRYRLVDDSLVPDLRLDQPGSPATVARVVSGACRGLVARSDGVHWHSFDDRLPVVVSEGPVSGARGWGVGTRSGIAWLEGSTLLHRAFDGDCVPTPQLVGPELTVSSGFDLASDRVMLWVVHTRDSQVVIDRLLTPLTWSEPATLSSTDGLDGERRAGRPRIAIDPEDRVWLAWAIEDSINGAHRLRVMRSQPRQGGVDDDP